MVVNYDLMSKQEAALAQRGFNIVVMDESHYLKNSKAKRTQSTLAIAKESKTHCACPHGHHQPTA